jgi:hypothetical protein
MPTSKKSPSSRASRNIYVEVEETINTKMFESLCFRGGSFYLFSCKNKKGGEKAQATKTDGVVFSAHFFLVGWESVWKGISFLPQHVQHETDQMHHLCKLSENLDVDPALRKATVNRKNKWLYSKFHFFN